MISPHQKHNLYDYKMTESWLYLLGNFAAAILGVGIIYILLILISLSR